MKPTFVSVMIVLMPCVATGFIAYVATNSVEYGVAVFAGLFTITGAIHSAASSIVDAIRSTMKS